jgi:hypothetical protein
VWGKDRDKGDGSCNSPVSVDTDEGAWVVVVSIALESI